MIDGRGRHKECAKALKVHELSKNGMTTREIAVVLNIKLPMVQYYLRQKVDMNQVNEEKKRGLVRCFYEAPEEIRIQVAELLGFDYKPTTNNDNTKIAIVDAYKKLALKEIAQQEVKNESKEEVVEEEPVEENSLLARAKDFLNGKISPDYIDETFTEDEQAMLRKSPKFVARFQAIVWGLETRITNESAIAELIMLGVK